MNYDKYSPEQLGILYNAILASQQIKHMINDADVKSFYVKSIENILK